MLMRMSENISSVRVKAEFSVCIVQILIFPKLTDSFWEATLHYLYEVGIGNYIYIFNRDSNRDSM